MPTRTGWASQASRAQRPQARCRSTRPRARDARRRRWRRRPAAQCWHTTHSRGHTARPHSEGREETAVTAHRQRGPRRQPTPGTRSRRREPRGHTATQTRAEPRWPSHTEDKRRPQRTSERDSAARERPPPLAREAGPPGCPQAEPVGGRSGGRGVTHRRPPPPGGAERPPKRRGLAGQWECSGGKYRRPWERGGRWAVWGKAVDGRFNTRATGS